MSVLHIEIQDKMKFLYVIKVINLNFVVFHTEFNFNQGHWI